MAVVGVRGGLGFTSSQDKGGTVTDRGVRFGLGFGGRQKKLYVEMQAAAGEREGELGVSSLTRRARSWEVFATRRVSF